MATINTAPLLSRVKSWQLVGLGLTGWCALYSAAMLTCGPGSFLVGNAQGGCFAVTMTLAGVEARRHRKNLSLPDTLEWTGAVTTEQLNQAIASSLREQAFRVEPTRDSDVELGFGVRSVNSGRTVVFETARWKEESIDSNHVQATDENRIKAHAQYAVIVGVGAPDDAAKQLAQSRPVEFLDRGQIKEILGVDKANGKKA
jgi:hypothetical protein